MIYYFLEKTEYVTCNTSQLRYPTEHNKNVSKFMINQYEGFFETIIFQILPLLLKPQHMSINWDTKKAETFLLKRSI